MSAAGSPSDQPVRTAENADHRAQLLHGQGGLFAQQEAERSPDTAHQDPQEQERKPEQARVDQHDIQRVASVRQVRAQPGGAEPAAPVRGGLCVMDHRLGREHDAVVGAVGAPAEVDVVPEDRQHRIEAAELVPDVAAHQHAGTSDRQHVLGDVVLALIILAPIEPGVPATAAGHGETDLQQLTVTAPAEDLRPDDARVRSAHCRLQEMAQRIRCGRAVVVQ